MPVGTLGTVKGIAPDELQGLGFGLMLSNAYHLYLRPGHHVIRGQGGLHQFTGWNGSILTDSGGFQVVSLAALREITDDGIAFQSHLDGSNHHLTPELCMDIQIALGSDIMMALDECPVHPCSREQARVAVGAHNEVGSTLCRGFARPSASAVWHCARGTGCRTPPTVRP